MFEINENFENFYVLSGRKNGLFGKKFKNPVLKTFIMNQSNKICSTYFVLKNFNFFWHPLPTKSPADYSGALSIFIFHYTPEIFITKCKLVLLGVRN